MIHDMMEEKVIVDEDENDRVLSIIGEYADQHGTHEAHKKEQEEQDQPDEENKEDTVPEVDEEEPAADIPEPLDEEVKEPVVEAPTVPE